MTQDLENQNPCFLVNGVQLNYTKQIPHFTQKQKDINIKYITVYNIETEELYMKADIFITIPYYQTLH